MNKVLKFFMWFFIILGGFIVLCMAIDEPGQAFAWGFVLQTWFAAEGWILIPILCAILLIVGIYKLAKFNPNRG